MGPLARIQRISASKIIEFMGSIMFSCSFMQHAGLWHYIRRLHVGMPHFKAVPVAGKSDGKGAADEEEDSDVEECSHQG